MLTPTPLKVPLKAPSFMISVKRKLGVLGRLTRVTLEDPCTATINLSTAENLEGCTIEGNEAHPVVLEEAKIGRIPQTLHCMFVLRLDFFDLGVEDLGDVVGP